MKKIAALILAVMLIIALVSCAERGNTTENGEDKTEYTIGICNYVDDASLNQIADSIKSRLSEIGEENDIIFDVLYDNCNGDASVMNQIIADYISDGVDLMIGIATHVAMAMQAATEDEDVPVVFAAVSDPVGAKLVDSMEMPGSNITGTSDYLNTDALLDLIFAYNPDCKTVGLLYDIGQDSSTAPIASAKNYLDKKGIKHIEKTGSTADEIRLAAQSLATSEVDAVFTPTDNTVMTCEMGIYEIFADAGIEHFCGADSFALNGAFAGYGVDYTLLGKETANTVKEILIDEKNPAEISVKTFDNGILTVNTDICEMLGVSFEDVSEIFEGLCTKVEGTVTAENFDDIK